LSQLCERSLPCRTSAAILPGDRAASIRSRRRILPFASSPRQRARHGRRRSIFACYDRL